METQGKRIKMLRENFKLTQPRLAEILDVDVSSVSAWEKNMCLPDYEKFMLICVDSDISPTWMITGKGPMLISDIVRLSAAGERELPSGDTDVIPPQIQSNFIETHDQIINEIRELRQAILGAVIGSRDREEIRPR